MEYQFYFGDRWQFQVHLETIELDLGTDPSS